MITPPALVAESSQLRSPKDDASPEPAESEPAQSDPPSGSHPLPSPSEQLANATFTR